MSAGFQEIDSLIREESKTPQRAIVAQPCFRYFDALGPNLDTHLSLFLMGAALYGPRSSWTMAEALDSLFSFLLSVGVPKDRLWISTFSGGMFENENIPADTAALPYWNQHGFPRSRAVHLGLAHNFWREGGISASGRPRFCGPQTEVFFDQTEVPCGHSKNCGPGCICGRFLEIANVISISYRYVNEREVELLRQPLCESVIGIERLIMAMENRNTMAETSYLRERLNRTIQNIPEISTAPHQALFEVFERLQAFCFLTSQGGVPSGRGRGFVLRRLFRTALERATVFEADTHTVVRAIVRGILLLDEEFLGMSLQYSNELILNTVEREIALSQRRSNTVDG